MEKDNPIPDFAILQNSRTKVSGVWTKERGEWVQAPAEDYTILGLIARLLRTSPHPEKLIKDIAVIVKNENNN